MPKTLVTGTNLSAQREPYFAREIDVVIGRGKAWIRNHDSQPKVGNI